MNRATELFDKILVDGQEINLQELDANGGIYSAGEEKTLKVDFVLKKSDTVPAKIFSGLTSLKSVKIPESITKVGNHAFTNTGATLIGLENIRLFGEGSLVGTNIENELKEQLKENHPIAFFERYTEEEAKIYNLNLPNALHYGDIKTPAHGAVPEHWIMNGHSYNEDPTYEESNSYDYIYDEESWNESFENGALGMYYTKYPTEDLWHTTANRYAGFNDRHYIGTIDNETVESDPKWVSSSAQSLVIDGTTYYAAIFYDTEVHECELFTDKALTISANKTYIITEVTYPNCEQCWAGAVHATGSKYPWIAPHFEGNDVNAKLIFRYENKEDARPWGDYIFGDAEGHKLWGMESVVVAFKDNTFLIPECSGNADSNYEGEAGVESAFDIEKFKLILEHQNVEYVEATEATSPVIYTDEEVDEYNAQLPGAVKAGDIKGVKKPEFDPWEDYQGDNSENQENQTVNGEVNSENDGNTQIYNGD